ncbi:thioredoxin family protein [Rossellomorea aquimaris]|uniref:thioredoxin family protein n=1 Tax=Rossellomorea aquimaris TaxID=189382 RepID=UPI001CD514E3|nr:thioredoxin family protein [Rossellomorea aquimaris]MCA1056107.1 thioredoxin family protein [Rossellomorea aquimaris]
MNEQHTLEEIKKTIQEETMVLLYISRPNCSVCHALLPQVEGVLEKYPIIVAVHADADEIPGIAGEFSIFTVPVVIVFIEGKEMMRKARFVPIDELEGGLSRLIAMFED